MAHHISATTPYVLRGYPAGSWEGLLSSPINALLHRLYPASTETKMVNDYLHRTAPLNRVTYDSSPSVNIRTGKMHLGGALLSPWVAAHELGHVLQHELDEPLLHFMGGGHEYLFAKRKHGEALDDMFGTGTSSTDYSQSHMNRPGEVGASLLGSYLIFPDSVPEFTKFVDPILRERGLGAHINLLRKVLGR